MKYNTEKFNGKNYFSLWRIKMQDILVQKGLIEALNTKEESSGAVKDEIFTKHKVLSFSVLVTNH